MCLVVRNIPVRKQIVISNKWLLSTLYSPSGFETPYMATHVPKDGWLFADGGGRKLLYSGTMIHGGHIHAYVGTKTPDWLGGDYDTYASYAFGVKAYSEKMTELACKALYIPAADRTGNSKTIEDIILGFARYDKRQILRKLPILERIQAHL